MSIECDHDFQPENQQYCQCSKCGIWINVKDVRAYEIGKEREKYKKALEDDAFWLIDMLWNSIEDDQKNEIMKETYEGLRKLAEEM